MPLLELKIHMQLIPFDMKSKGEKRRTIFYDCVWHIFKYAILAYLSNPIGFR